MYRSVGLGPRFTHGGFEFETSLGKFTQLASKTGWISPTLWKPSDSIKRRKFNVVPIFNSFALLKESYVGLQGKKPWMPIRSHFKVTNKGYVLPPSQ